MHICIIGPGAIGLFLAAQLAQHAQVTLVDRHITKATKQTIHVTGLLEREAQVNLSPRIVDADLIMVTTKAVHLETVSESLTNCSVSVIFWQNGLGINHLVKTLLPKIPLIRALIWVGVSRESSHTVHCDGFSRIILGSLQGNADLQTLLTHLSNAGLTTEIVSSIDRAEWEKSLWNIGVNGLCAITGERNGVIVDSPHLRELLMGLIHEAQAVARALGHTLDLEESMIRLTRVTATNLNSMLQDIRVGHRTEIDYMNGYVVRLGRQVGIETPYNAAIYHLVKHIEGRHLSEVN
jgi:2-dehydropantoate 2-reductase